MAQKLSDAETRQRMADWHNWKKELPHLREENRLLKRRVRELEQEVVRLKHEYVATVETLKLQIEELREMVFGRKRDDDDASPSQRGRSHSSPKKNGKLRSPDSYRRPIPQQEEVTEEHRYGIDACPNCGEALVDLREVVRYLEDIVLPGLRGRTVEKQMIETGFCRKCRTWRSLIPIAKQVCSLGDNVRQRIVHCVTILGMPFEKVRTDLRDTFGIAVSDGEIAHILTTEAVKLLPEYHDIDVRIRGSPAKHLDETRWPVQREGEGSWGWVKTASDTCDTLFRLGRSRGKGNARALHDEQGQPTITDDYGAYDFLGDDQGLCWAHPKRKFRDLAQSTSLNTDRREHCARFYERFCHLFLAVQTVVGSPYDREEREREAVRFRHRIRRLCTPDPADPAKLATLRTTFLENTEAYLLCVRREHVPMTNNKAERSLRPLVIKRKLSFGSRTQKGADVMSILLSVCFTLWWKKPENFYEAYREIVRKWQPA